MMESWMGWVDESGRSLEEEGIEKGSKKRDIRSSLVSATTPEMVGVEGMWYLV